ncbi:MAG: twin-arginine translocase TatA/TatE family subunit [bacterium]
MTFPGTGEIIVILVIALLVFGPKKLPEIGKAVGGAVTEFKKGISGLTDEIEKPAAKPAAEQPKQVEAVQETKPQEPAG